jgi:hypothetical protein
MIENDGRVTARVFGFARPADRMGLADAFDHQGSYGRWMPDADSDAGSRAEAVYGKKKDAAKVSGAS